MIIWLLLSQIIIAYSLNPRIVTESPRWLVSRGRMNDAIKIMRKMAKVNKKKLPPGIFDDWETQNLQEVKVLSKLIMQSKSSQEVNFRLDQQSSY